MPLKLDLLSHRYGNTWALRDISFEVDDGSVIGLFGASGSGKSTLLKVLAGAAKATSGQIELDGRDITGLKRKERRLSLYTGSSSKTFIELLRGPFERGSQGAIETARFEAAAETIDRVWLLDEPFGQMDAAQRSACFEMIRRAAKARGRIVIFASSSFDQILELTDEVAVMDEGEVIQSGTPQQIYDEPLSVKVARATGEMNLIKARRLTSSDADLPEFYTIDGAHRLFAQQTQKSRLGPINQDATLAIRPEQVSMSLGSSFPEDNLLRAVVTAIKFRGPTSIIEFDAGGLRLMTRLFRVVGLQIGDECMLGLPPHRVSILSE